MQTLRDASKRQEYDAQLVRNRQLLAMPIWESIGLEDMDPGTQIADPLTYACRCGGCFVVDALNAQAERRLIVPCDTCSLFIEVTTSK